MRWLRNRRRWQARRAVVEHERVLRAAYDELAVLQGRKRARYAALGMDFDAVADAFLMAQAGIR